MSYKIEQQAKLEPGHPGKPATELVMHRKPSVVPAQAEAAPVVQPETAPTTTATPHQSEADKAFEYRERQIREQQKQLQAEKQAFEQEKQKLKPGMSQEEWAEQFRQDPTKMGFSYDELAEKFLKAPSPESQAINLLQSQIEDLKSQLVKQQEQYTVAQQQAYENAVKQIESDATRLVAMKPQEYELIAAMGRTKDIAERIKQRFHNENVLMSVEEAAQQLEAELLEQASLYAGLNKVKAKISPPAQQDSEAPTMTGEKKTTHVQQTLTNAMKGSATMDRMTRARLAFEGKLNK
jgi:DNA repair exonuclease SbcCD ATPase subunit